ncbi:hypothetical protein Tco_0341724 [Tanacetum coccineum]
MLVPSRSSSHSIVLPSSSTSFVDQTSIRLNQRQRPKSTPPQFDSRRQHMFQAAPCSREHTRDRANVNLQPTVLSFASAEYTRDRDRANYLNTSACVASDIDCRSSCTKTQDLDRMPVETITVADQNSYKEPDRHSQDMPLIQINSSRLQPAWLTLWRRSAFRDYPGPGLGNYGSSMNIIPPSSGGGYPDAGNYDVSLPIQHKGTSHHLVQEIQLEVNTARLKKLVLLAEVSTASRS